MAEELINFHDFLWNADTKCFIVRMMYRKDLSDENAMKRIRATNKILKARLNKNSQTHTSGLEQFKISISKIEMKPN